jgi:cell division protease FtsH
LRYLFSAMSIKTIPYSEFLKLVKEGKVSEVAITQSQIQGRLLDDGSGSGKGELFRTVRVDSNISQLFEKNNITFEVEIESTFFRDLFSWIFPIFIFVGIWYFMIRRMTGHHSLALGVAVDQRF